METPHEEPYSLKPSDVAELVGVSPETVRRWASEGHLAHYKSPSGHRRFRRSDVLKFVKAGKAAS
jgi:excisionase family DNA binding protein